MGNSKVGIAENFLETGKFKDSAKEEDNDANQREK